jgi:hypothetical protein
MQTHEMIRTLQLQLQDISRQLRALQRLDVGQASVPSNNVVYSGTPTAGRLAQWTGAGTVEQTSYAGSAVVRYSGVPTAGAITYWTGNGTVAHASYGTADVTRYSGAPSAGDMAYWTAAGTVTTAGFGTAAVVRTSDAQTITGVKTFSSGISFGEDTLSAYDEGSWSPVITGSTSDPTVTYSTQVGLYTRFGNLVAYTFTIVINTVSGGGGNLHVSLPLVANSNYIGSASLSGVDVPTGAINTVFMTLNGQAVGRYHVDRDDATLSNVPVTGLAAGDTLRATGIYFV